MHSPTLGLAFGVVVTLLLCVGSTVLEQSDFYSTGRALSV